MTNNQNPPTPSTGPQTGKKIKKKDGIIRWNALVPLVVFITIIYLYMALFFDSHVKWLIEWGGYKALGAEINLQEFKSSFIHGNVEIKRIQITDKEQPEYNAIELSQAQFNVNMDALLRLKGVIETIAVEGIQFRSRRAEPGRVAPPEPESNEPSFTAQLQGRALGKLESENKTNLIGDIAEFLKNGDINGQLKNFESQIQSKKMAEDLNTKWGQKKVVWDERIKTLPKQDDINNLKDRFSKIKYKDFRSAEELNISLSEFNGIKSEIEAKVDLLNQTKTNLTSDAAQFQSDFKNFEAQIKSDTDNIKNRFKIPQLDAKSFARSLFMSYLTPYTLKLDRYKKMAQKYLPPKYADMLSTDKKKLAAGDDTIQPHAREKGISYEFPKRLGYPLFWIQKVSLSSRSNAQVDFGDMNGTITDITSNQSQINKQTELNVAGEFKSKDIYGVKLFAALNNLKTEPEVKFSMNVGSYMIHGITLTESADVIIKIPTSNNSLAVRGSTLGFKSYDLSFSNQFNNVKFDLNAKDKTVSEILSGTFGRISQFDLNATASGGINDLKIDISSSLGSKLEAAFKTLLQAKLDEVNKMVKAKIEEEVGKQKIQLEKQLSQLTGGYVTQVSQAQGKLDEQKNLVNDRIASAKRDLENKAKAKMQEEGKKVVDDLKKKLGF